MGKTIKKLQEGLQHNVSFYQESNNFAIVKVRNFIQGFWHGEAEAKASYPD